MRILKLTLALAVASVVPCAAQDATDMNAPRVSLTASAGKTLFRGGDTGGVIAQQPDVSATTFGGSLAFGLVNRVALELSADWAKGREVDGFDTADNLFLTGGLKIALMPRARFSPYITLGGGVVNREVAEEFDEIVEEAFEVGDRDPLAYAGAGVDFRLASRFGIRGDYRYQRIFPDDIADLDITRDSYAAHRITGGLVLSF